MSEDASYYLVIAIVLIIVLGLIGAYYLVYGL